MSTSLPKLNKYEKLELILRLQPKENAPGFELHDLTEPQKMAISVVKQLDKIKEEKEIKKCENNNNNNNNLYHPFPVLAEYNKASHRVNSSKLNIDSAHMSCFFNKELNLYSCIIRTDEKTFCGNHKDKLQAKALAAVDYLTIEHGIDCSKWIK